MPACVDGQYNSPYLSGVDYTLTAHYYNNSDGKECAPTDAQRAARPLFGIARPASALCGAFNFEFSKCIWYPLVAAIGSALISLAAWLLEVVGLLFNYLLWYTVIAFGDATNGFLTQGILDGINTTWTVFRDIANILIIGLFTFIAISTILGNHEFGAKKMLAKALIIAVLINFSLLFTKMIIDVSNFTAYQFYNSASNLKVVDVGQVNTNQTTAANGTASLSFTQDGIAGQFIKYLGVTSLADVNSSLQQGAANADSGWVALLHGVFGATLLLATAAVLLYGSFLLVSRAILIVFLLITSSLAFAAYLLPKSLQGSYGWSTWWDSLIKTAVFAPLLMMFLWATLQLATQMNRGGTGTLGKLMTDPTNASNLSALFGYIILIGMLFASFKISSSFASKIAGFNMASMLTALPFGMAMRGLVAPILRNAPIIGGRGGARRALKLEDEIAQEKLLASATGDYSKVEKLLRSKGKAEAQSKRTYDLMNTQIGAAIGKAVHLPGGMTSATKTNYADSAKAVAEHAAKEAASATVSKAEAAKYASEQIGKEGDMKNRALREQHDTNVQLVNAANKMAEAAKDGEKLTTRLTSQRKIESEAKEKKLEIHRDHDSGKIASAADRDRMLREQDDRIQTARTEVRNIESRMQVIDNDTGLTAAKADMGASRQKLNEAAEETNKAIEKMAENMVKNSREGAKEMAEGLARHDSGILRRLVGDDTFANTARHKVGSKIRVRRLKDEIAARKEIEDDDKELTASTPAGGTTPAPATGSTTTPH